MVTTSTATVSSTPTITNNGNMLLYNNSPTVPGTSGLGVGGGNTCNSSTLEQYRLQLYNYALNMERLRGPPYTAAAMAAAAAYASSTTVATTSASGQTHHGSSYTTPQAPPPPSSSYICATATGLIAASSHMGGHSATMAQCPTNNRLALASMSLFPQRIFQPEEPKPQHSYIGLIAMAILSSAETKLVLSDIYQYILDNYPYFRTRGPGWRNSIRHNLSLNDCFIKSGRSANGKGHYWAIHPANMDDFRKGDFRRRKAQRKVRKHMGLAVDDNGTDSPSPPPAMDLTSPSPPSSFQQHCASVMGGAIAPLATAAQQLAAHSFGWRLTQHHRQQTTEHTTGIQSGSSYMGQIFTYRPQQHYAAAAAAAAALCNSGSTSQHQQQQHLITTTNHNQQNHMDNSFPNHKKHTTYISASHDKLEQRQSSPLSSTRVNIKNEIFSQKRKRQFDVASLLAPDNSHKREHHPYLRNAKPESPQPRPLNGHDSVVDDDDEAESASANDLDIEDIDVVVASEDEDIEADYEQDDEEEEVDYEDSNCNSQRSQDEEDEEESEYTLNFDKVQHSESIKNHCEEESRIKGHGYEPTEEEEDDDDNDDVNDQIQHLKSNNNNNDNNCDKNKDMCIYKQNHPVAPYELFTNSQSYTQIQQPLRQHSPAPQAIRTTTITPSPPPPIVTHILETTDHHHHHNQLPLNDAHHLFGRYYGTYIAAAAAARINSSIPANIVENID